MPISRISSWLVLLGFISLLLLQGCNASRQPDVKQLEDEVHHLLDHKHMEVGVAAILNGIDTVTVNNDVHYPLMSVFKYHQALAVVHTLSTRKVSLDTLLYVTKEELRPDTYSPLRDCYPEGNIYLSVRQLLEYTLWLSDNNACDILFDHVCNVTETAGYLRSRGADHFDIVANERQMQEDEARCHQNWTTPLSAAWLLERLLDGSLVAGEYRQFIVDTMMSCSTGQSRLPTFSGQADVRFGHKTGTGGMNADGEILAVNDIGFFYLPDGRYYTLAVFVRNSKESMTETEAVIAAISETVYQFMAGYVAE